MLHFLFWDSFTTNMYFVTSYLRNWYLLFSGNHCSHVIEMSEIVSTSNQHFKLKICIYLSYTYGLVFHLIFIIIMNKIWSWMKTKDNKTIYYSPRNSKTIKTSEISRIDALFHLLLLYRKLFIFLIGTIMICVKVVILFSRFNISTLLS